MSINNIIVFTNQKGGVGKTTSALNIAAMLALHHKVLLIDLDPQGNATTGSGIEKNTISQSIYDVLLNNADINHTIIPIEKCGYDLLPSNRNLAGAEIELVDAPKREYKLKNSLMNIVNQYDYIIIDCPPSLSLLTLNALCAANKFIVPIQCEYYALEGLADLLSTVSLVQKSINPTLELLGLIRTMFDKRNNLAVEVSNELIKHFGDKLFKTCIPRNIRLAEAPSYGLPAVLLDKDASGSMAYKKLANEIRKKIGNT